MLEALSRVQGGSEWLRRTMPVASGLSISGRVFSIFEACAASWSTLVTRADMHRWPTGVALLRARAFLASILIACARVSSGTGSEITVAG